MLGQRLFANNPLDSILLVLTGFDGDPGARREHQRRHDGNRPRAPRVRAAVNRPQRAAHDDRQEEADHDGKMHHRRVEWVWKHRVSDSSL
jgi:hypothetical protein